MGNRLELHTNPSPKRVPEGSALSGIWRHQPGIQYAPNAERSPPELSDDHGRGLGARSASGAFPRDYQLPAELHALVLRAAAPSVGRSVAAALWDHLAIVAILLAAILVYEGLPLALALPLNAVALVTAARFHRGLECLVHEASHYNWSRRRRKLNDVAADLLAALPCFSRVSRYRPQHMVHHAYEGAPIDPDRVRYERLAIEAIDRTSPARFARGVATRILPYAWGWWRAIGTDPRTFALGALWQGVFVFAPAAAIGGLQLALFLVVNWLAAFFLLLPVIRFVGEAGEHLYLGSGTLLSSTINNEGAVHRLLFHPHNDGYHATHHLWPGVPHHRLRALHARLIRLDPSLAGRILRRATLLQDPAPTPSPADAGAVPQREPSRQPLARWRRR